MVSNRKSRHTEFQSSVNILFYIGNPVHVGHLGMKMQLHALFFRIVHTLRPNKIRLFNAEYTGKLQFLVVLVVFDIPFYGYSLSNLQKGSGVIQIFFFHKDFRGDGIGIVRKGESKDDHTGFSGRPFIHMKNNSLQRHGSGKFTNG